MSDIILNYAHISNKIFVYEKLNVYLQSMQVEYAVLFQTRCKDDNIFWFTSIFVSAHSILRGKAFQ